MGLLGDVGKEELMRKGIKDIVEKFDICFTCRKVFNHFIDACGITLVLSFFSENIENYTRENIVAMVAMIFLFICIFDFTYSIMFTVTNGDTICEGGAEQFNTALPEYMLKRIGVEY
mgnify:CR=1 FL=1